MTDIHNDGIFGEPARGFEPTTPTSGISVRRHMDDKVADSEIIEILDIVVEERCCEHGIRNKALSDEKAIRSLRVLFNKRERAVSELYEKGEVYLGKRGIK